MFIDFNIEINKTISTPYAQFCFFWGGGEGVIMSRRFADFHTSQKYEYAVNFLRL